MKKVKKSDKARVSWKFVAVLAAICGSAVIVCFGWRVMKRLDDLEKSHAYLVNQGLRNEINQPVQVSEDGKWYIIPEIRARFPYSMELKSDMSIYTLLKRVSVMMPEDEDEGRWGWNVSFTYGWMDVDDVCSSSLSVYSGYTMDDDVEEGDDWTREKLFVRKDGWAVWLYSVGVEECKDNKAVQALGEALKGWELY